MAGFKVVQDVCHGRDFTAPAGGVKGGLLYAIATSGIASLVSGGLGWSMQDDQRALGTDPYIVLCSLNAPGANTPAKFIQFLMPTATGSQIRAFYWLYWDPATHTGRGLYGAHNIRTDDSVDFIYDFRGGPECLFLHTYTTAATWEGTWIDEFTLDPNIIDSVSATTAVLNYTDNGNIQFRGIDLTGGTMANGLDVNGNMYISVILVSGSTYRIDIFNNTARGAGDLIWRSNTFTGLANSAARQTLTGTAQNSSGVTYNVYMQGPTVADATIVFRQNKITVGTGEGAQFTVGNYYFIYDLTTRLAVNSFLVTAKSGDVLSVDRLYRPFPIGAKIGSYPHPYFVAGTGNSLWGNRAGIPYMGVTGTMGNFVSSETGSQSGIVEISNASTLLASGIWNFYPAYGPSAVTSAEDNYITRQSPNRKGLWALQRPGIVERTAHESESAGSWAAKAAYGQLKNVILGAQGTMTANLHGRTLGGIDYLFFRLINAYVTSSSQSWAACIRDTQSNT